MAKGDKVTITFDGKNVECTEVCPGGVQKTESIFYIQDSVSKEWNYSFPGRFQKLLEKHNGDLSGYKNRASKAAERNALKAQKRAEREAKKIAKAAAPAAPAAAPAGLEMIDVTAPVAQVTEQLIEA